MDTLASGPDAQSDLPAAILPQPTPFSIAPRTGFLRARSPGLPPAPTPAYPAPHLLHGAAAYQDTPPAERRAELLLSPEYQLSTSCYVSNTPGLLLRLLAAIISPTVLCVPRQRRFYAPTCASLWQPAASAAGGAYAQCPHRRRAAYARSWTPPLLYCQIRTVCTTAHMKHAALQPREDCTTRELGPLRPLPFSSS